MTQTHIVMKPISIGNGQMIASGTAVDASKWRNVEKLIASRYLRPATADEIEPAEAIARTGKKGKGESRESTN